MKNSLLKSEVLSAKNDFIEKTKSEKILSYDEFFDKASKRNKLRKDNIDLFDTIFNVTYRYVIFLWVLFISTGYLLFVKDIIDGMVSNGQKLSDSVIIAILTSTTATIIGLPALITSSLFPKDKQSKKHK